MTALSLFSGAGGMDVGLEAAGFRIIGAVEKDVVARKSLLLNRPGANLLGKRGDVIEVAASLTPEDLGLNRGDLALICGGPPCQPFSAAAQWAASGRKGMRDPRAKTVDATIELIDKFLPRAVLMENVLGFVQGQHSALDYLKQAMLKISQSNAVTYSVNWRLLNAADFGVPQNRRRVIIVILRDDVTFDWPEPTHGDRPITAFEALSDVTPKEVPIAAGKWASLLPSIPEGKNYLWLTSRGEGPEIFGYRTRYWNFLLKLARDLPSWTLSASPGPSTGPFHWENRPLAVEEQLRLQTLPKDWKLEGDYRAATRQIGNATPSLLAEHLGRQLLHALSLPGRQGQLELSVSRDSAVTHRPLPVAPVAEVYLPLVGPKSAHAGEGKGPGARMLSTNDEEWAVSA